MPKTKDNINPSLDRQQEELQTKVLKLALLKFKESTPKRTGNARKKTNLRGNTIEAKYSYATNLDKGSSRKAPKGMTEPTRKFLNKYIETRIVRK